MIMSFVAFVNLNKLSWINERQVIKNINRMAYMIAGVVKKSYLSLERKVG